MLQLFLVLLESEKSVGISEGSRVGSVLLCENRVVQPHAIGKDVALCRKMVKRKSFIRDFLQRANAVFDLHHGAFWGALRRETHVFGVGMTSFQSGISGRKEAVMVW